MRAIQRFEDLIAWQRARALTTDIYAATREGAFARDYGLAGQIQRAAVSIMSNIAEGYERDRPAEFFHFLSIAKASCAELRSQLYIALDVGYLDRPTFDRLYTRAEEVGKIIGGLRISVGKRKTPPWPMPNSSLITHHSSLERSACPKMSGRKSRYVGTGRRRRRAGARSRRGWRARIAR